MSDDEIGMLICLELKDDMVLIQRRGEKIEEIVEKLKSEELKLQNIEPANHDTRSEMVKEMDIMMNENRIEVMEIIEKAKRAVELLNTKPILNEDFIIQLDSFIAFLEEFLF